MSSGFLNIHWFLWAGLALEGAANIIASLGALFYVIFILLTFVIK